MQPHGSVISGRYLHFMESSAYIVASNHFQSCEEVVVRLNKLLTKQFIL